jgi:hypothetical protein
MVKRPMQVALGILVLQIVNLFFYGWGMGRVPLSDPPIKAGSLSTPLISTAFTFSLVVLFLYYCLRRFDDLENQLERLKGQG